MKNLSINLSLSETDRKRLEYLRYKLNRPISKIIKKALLITFMEFDYDLQREGLGVTDEEIDKATKGRC